MADDVNGAQAAPATDTVQDTAPQSQPAQNNGDLWDGQPFDAERAKSLIETLRGEVKALKPKAKAADDYERQVKAQKDAELSEVERLKKELSEMANQYEAVKRREMAAKVAAQYGLPAPLAERLKGNSEEEMAADAAELAKALPKQAANISPTNPGNQAATTETEAQKRARIYGGGQSVFDPAAARAKGGGVIQ